MKTCTICSKVKAKSEFHKYKDYKDGLYPYCKACSKEKRAKNKRPMEPKVCNKCKELLGPEAFCKNASRADGLHSVCKNCMNVSQNSRSSSVRGRHYNNMASVKTSYNLTESDLQTLLHKHQGCCSICSADFGLIESDRNRPYHIDHCHKTGRVRGLLCSKCNLLLGKIEANFKDVPKFLSYIETNAPGAGF